MSPKTTGRIAKRDMKQDKFVSWIFYLTEQFQEQKKVILGALGGIVAVIILVMLIVNHQSAQREQVREMFGRASIEMRSGNASLAIIDFRKIIDEHSGSTLAGLACYYLANAYYDQREWNEAEIIFKRYLDEFGDDPLLIISSHSGIAGCLEQKGEFGPASDMYYEAAMSDLDGIMAGELLFAAVRTACDAKDSTRAMRAYQALEDNLSDVQQYINPAKLYVYEHGYLAPPTE